MIGSKGEGGVKIVIPALVDGGADGQLHLGPQALDGLSHNVGAGVPEGLAVLRVFKGVQVFFRHNFTSKAVGDIRYKMQDIRYAGWKISYILSLITYIFFGMGIKNSHP